MKRHKRYTRRKHLLKRVTAVLLLLILGFVFVQTASYIMNLGEIPVLGSFSLFRKEADTSLGWNLILVNDDYHVPADYEVELTELSNGEKVDSRKMFLRCGLYMACKQCIQIRLYSKISF